MAEKSKGKQPEAAQEKEVRGNDPGKKSGKVSRLSLSEVEAALAKAEKEMGGFQSRYARFLLDRKKMLLSGHSVQTLRRKAA